MSSDLIPTRVSYESVDAYNKYDEEVREIIVEDTGKEPSATKSLPPVLFGFSLTECAFDKLKAIGDGVIVKVQEEE